MQTVFLLAFGMFPVLLIDGRMPSTTHVALELWKDDPGHPQWTSLSQHPQPGSPLLKDLRGVSGLLHPFLKMIVPVLSSFRTDSHLPRILSPPGKQSQTFSLSLMQQKISSKHLTHVQAS